MSRHSEISDPYEIHFPKGFTGASVDTFPVKTASNEMTWRDVRYYMPQIHCATQFGAPTLNTAVTAVTVSGTYYPVTVDSNLWTEIDMDGFTFVNNTSNGHIQIDTTGHYVFFVSFTCVGNASSSTDDYKFALSRGNTYDNSSVVVDYPPILMEGPGNGVHAGRSACFYLECVAGDKVGIMLTNATATDGICMQTCSIVGYMLHT